MSTLDEPVSRHTLQCMEIWGGSSAANTRVATPGLDLWVYSQPFEEAADGGDVHYVSLCGGGVITRFVLADVAGHGASVAELARLLRDLMRRNINRKSQARLVGELNRQFAEFAKSSRFATAIVATYLTTRDELAVSNAGHPAPLRFEAASGCWSYVAGHVDDDGDTLENLPLGIDDSTGYTQVCLALGQGDLVLFYTDALIEAASADDQQLGEVGLLELVRRLNAAEPAGLVARLIEAVAEYRGGKPCDDDATVLLLHHNAEEPRRLTISQKLDVYAKVFRLKSV